MTSDAAWEHAHEHEQRSRREQVRYSIRCPDHGEIEQLVGFGLPEIVPMCWIVDKNGRHCGKALSLYLVDPMS